MYAHFYNLTAEPFRLSPDHRFCYGHSKYFKAKAYMAYAFLRAEGFVMVTGRPGTGKTTLIGDLIESLADENVAVANLVSTQLAADDLLRMVAFAFGLTAESGEKSTVLQQLNSRFLDLHREGGRALLIVDEAQDLTPKAMEELRLLTNLQQDGKPLVQIFLLGQPELRELIHDPGLEQVHQRIIAASHLEALKDHETREYVEHRLNVVGWRNDPAISTAVFPIIHLFSEGVPRRINLICSRLFLQGCVEQRHQIGVADARNVVEELQEEQLSTRNLLHDDLFLAQDVFEEIRTEEPEPEPEPERATPREPPPQDPAHPAPDVDQEVAAKEPWAEEIPAVVSDPCLAEAVSREEEPLEDFADTRKFSANEFVDERPEGAEGMPAANSKIKTTGVGNEQLSTSLTEKAVSARTWFALLGFLLAGLLVAFLLMDESFYETVVTQLRHLYVTLVTELERGWCRLSSTC